MFLTEINRNRKPSAEKSYLHVLSTRAREGRKR